jgi:hypothetical protein
MTLDQYTTMRGYQQAETFTGSTLVDLLIADQGEQAPEALKLKRIQFDTTPALNARLESVCQLLSCTKRHFLEMAISEAIQRADANFQKAFHEAAGVDLAEAYPAAAE